MAKLHLCQQILDIIYPIGSVYISVNTTNPQTLFGGGWTRITGRFLLAADDSTYKNGSTGGEATHKLTISEIPSHNHNHFANSNIRCNNDTGGAWANQSMNVTVIDNPTSKTGGGKAHNNMPPYLAVYMWKRTS